MNTVQVSCPTKATNENCVAAKLKVIEFVLTIPTLVAAVLLVGSFGVGEHRSDSMSEQDIESRNALPRS